MARYLSQIKRSKWYRHSGVSWLGADDLQADALADVYTKDNALSVWLVEDDGVVVDRIVAALAAKRNVPTNFDYTLIDDAAARALAVEIEESPAETADAMVSALHRDFVRLTRDKLVRLVDVIALSGKERVLPGRVRELILLGLSGGVLERNAVNEELLTHLEG